MRSPLHVPTSRLVALTLAGCLLLGGSRARAQKPIPAGPGVPTTADLYKAFAEIDARRFSEYEQHTTDPKELRGEALQFLKDVRKVASGQINMNEGKAEVARRGVKLVERGCTDPLIVAATALISHGEVTARETYAYCKHALDHIDGSPYSQQQHFWVVIKCHYRQSTAVNDAPSLGQKHYPPNKERVQETLVRWMAEEGKNEEYQRFLWSVINSLIKERGVSFIEPVVEGAVAAEGVHPWLLNMVRGKFHLEQGMWYKGGTQSHQDYPDQMRQAAKYLVEADRLVPRFPEAAAEMMVVAREGCSDQNLRYWFDKAVAAEFDNPRAYENMIVGLRPTYGGSFEALFEFGKECAATGRHETQVPYVLMRTLQSADYSLGRDAGVFKREGVYDAVVDFCREAAEAPVLLGHERGDLTRASVAAWQLAVAARAEKYDEVGRLWPKTTPTALQDAVKQYAVTTPLPVLRAMGQSAVGGRTGEMKAPAAAGAVGAVAELERLVSQVRDADSARAAVKRLEEIAAKAGDEDQEWLTYWQAMVSPYEDYFAGRWAEIKFPKGLLESAGAPKWARIDDRTLETRGTYRLPLQSLARLPGPLEVEFDVQTIERAEGATLAGVLLGNYPHKGTIGCFFGVDSGMGKAGVHGLINLPFKIDRADVAHVRVLAWRTYYEFYVNGKRVYKASQGPFSPTENFVLWSPGPDDASVIVRFKNLRVRRFPLGSPPYWSDYESRIVYFTQRIGLDPQDVYSYLERGDAYYDVEQPAKALADYLKTLELRPGWDPGDVGVGMALAGCGRYEEAVAKYESILKRNPDNYPTLERLAWLQATCPDEKFRDAKQALQRAQRAKKLARGGSKYKLTVAAAHAANGDFAEAQKQVNSARDERWLKDRCDEMQAAFEKEQPYLDVPPDPGS